MPNNRDKFQKNTFYHVYNRGYMKEKLFFQEADYQRFIRKILIYEDKYSKYIEIKKFCILPNHFHFIILNKKRESFDISNFMRRLEISYAMYSKRKYTQMQNLDNIPIFEGRFKAKLIQDNEYLKELETYIEKNPIKHGYIKNDEVWRWKGPI